MARIKSAIGGALVAAAGYGLVRKTLFDRDMIVEYKVDQIRRLMLNHKKSSANAMMESAEKLPVREHEYYTAVRVAWNSSLMALRSNLVELFMKSK